MEDGVNDSPEGQTAACFCNNQVDSETPPLKGAGMDFAVIAYDALRDEAKYLVLDTRSSKRHS